MTFDEIFKTSLVFVHFFASAVALATILRADFLILTHFTSKLSPKACARIHSAKSVVSGALMVLWLTGIMICVHGYMHDPSYVLNQKLWMKVLVVLTLSVNGWFLHRFAFHAIQPGARLSDALPRQRMILTLMACLSSSSWVFACFLGIARALNNRENFAGVMEAYLVMLAVNIAVGLMLTALLARLQKRGALHGTRREPRLLEALKRRASDWQESELQV
ncbi:MAG: hypothetical protein QM749_06985 [Aquabacterium sp.]